MSRKSSYLSILIMVVLCIVMLATSAQAQKDERYLKYRQKLMSAIGGHMGSIGNVAKPACRLWMPLRYMPSRLKCRPG